MTRLSEQERSIRRRGQAAAAAIVSLFVTGMVVLGTPQDAEPLDGVPAALAVGEPASAPAAVSASEPAIYSPDGMPWQWEAEQP